jgi:hypothetical protein
VFTDTAKSQSSDKSVSNGMAQDIGIRMTCKPFFERDLDTAYNKLSVTGKPV